MIQQQQAETNHGVTAREPSLATLAGPSIVAWVPETGAVPPRGDIAPLLSKVASKDPSALAELYRLTGGKLFTITLLILKRHDLAEQILQRSYITIWKDAACFDNSLNSPID